MRKFLIFVGLVVFPLAFPAAAHAVPPQTIVVTVDNESFIDEETCDFPITVTENGTFKIKFFVDQEGNREMFILSNQSPFTAAYSANGKTLVSNEPFVIIRDFKKNTRTIVGLVVALHVPGEGLILLGAGRLVIDLATGEVVFEAGAHQDLEGDVTAFCNFFADP